MNENQNQKVNQANNQEGRKTIVNGKIVSLAQAQAAEAAFNSMETQTGIQAHHSNHTEAVQAGQVGKTTNGAEAGASETYTIKQSNVQSAQAHMEQHMNQAGQSQEQAQQQQQQQQMQAEADQQAMQAQQQTKGLKAQKKGE
jgi:hypothetical protein